MPQTKKSKIAHIPLVGSKWQITINTNQTPEDGNLDLFTSIIANLVLSRNIFNFFKWKPDRDSSWILDPSLEQLYESTDDLSILSGVEIGHIHRKIHANITISLTHYHYFQLDIPKMIAWVEHVSGGRIRTPGKQFKVEQRSYWPTDRKYTIKDYGYLPEFSIHNKFYGPDGRSRVFNDEVSKNNDED